MDRNWVSDSLYELIGISERHLVDFLIATGERPCQTVGKGGWMAGREGGWQRDHKALSGSRHSCQFAQSDQCGLVGRRLGWLVGQRGTAGKGKQGPCLEGCWRWGSSTRDRNLRCCRVVRALSFPLLVLSPGPCTAKSAKSPASILESLRGADVPISDKANRFAQELYSKFGKKHVQVRCNVLLALMG
jgi:hypothetical protein